MAVAADIDKLSQLCARSDIAGPAEPLGSAHHFGELPLTGVSPRLTLSSFEPLGAARE